MSRKSSASNKSGSEKSHPLWTAGNWQRATVPSRFYSGNQLIDKYQQLEMCHQQKTNEIGGLQSELQIMRDELCKLSRANVLLWLESQTAKKKEREIQDSMEIYREVLLFVQENETRSQLQTLQKSESQIRYDEHKKRMHLLNSTQVKVGERRDIRMRSMNRTLFHSEQGCNSTRAALQKPGAIMDFLEIGNEHEQLSKEWKAKHEQSKHEWLWYGVIGGGAGIAILLMCLFGVAYIFRKHRRKSNRKKEIGPVMVNNSNDSIQACIIAKTRTLKIESGSLAPFEDWKSITMTQQFSDEDSIHSKDDIFEGCTENETTHHLE